MNLEQLMEENKSLRKLLKDKTRQVSDESAIIDAYFRIVDLWDEYCEDYDAGVFGYNVAQIISETEEKTSC